MPNKNKPTPSIRSQFIAPGRKMTPAARTAYIEFRTRLHALSEADKEIFIKALWEKLYIPLDESGSKRPAIERYAGSNGVEVSGADFIDFVCTLLDQRKLVLADEQFPPDE